MNSTTPKYYSIGEVCRIVGIKPYTLRYWEKKTSLIRPVRRSFDRRYYTKACLDNISQLYHMIYNMGYSINEASDRLSSVMVNGQRYKAVVDRIREVLSE